MDFLNRQAVNWRGAGAVERGAFEMRCAGIPRTQGSNPCPSAKFSSIEKAGGAYWGLSTNETGSCHKVALIASRYVTYDGNEEVGLYFNILFHFCL